MERYTPSPFQQAIFDFIQNDTRNAVVNAVAGSGKTTTLLMAIERVLEDKEILFMAYNKHIEQELILKADPHDNLYIRTVHSFGNEALRVYNPGCTVNGNKYRGIFRDVMDYYTTSNESKISKYSFDKKHMSVTKKIKKIVSNLVIDEFPEFTTNIIDLCNLGRLYNIDPDIKQRGTSLLRKLAQLHSIPYDKQQHDIAWYLIKLGLFYTNEIDYTDMIYIPVVLDLEVPKYDYVFIDECQDISTCQRTLMLKAIKPDSGRFIAVGDPAQGIYAFAGADEQSFQALLNLPNTVTLPLSITYRCAKPIVDYIKPLNSQIQHREDNLDGEILQDFSHKDVKDGDMVLCRQTFPLVSLCIKYLSEGKKSYIIGSDIGKSIANMVNRAKSPGVEYTMGNVLKVLYTDLQQHIQKVMDLHGMSRDEAANEEYIVMTREKILAIEALSRGIDDPKIVIKKINNLFSDEHKSGICLSTVHKSKGLENDRVFILHPELMPSKRAELDWEITQEKNIQYVAFTRAMRTLGFITDYDAFNGTTAKMNEIGTLETSKHIGKPNMSMKFSLKVAVKRKVNGKWGETFVYEMVDKDGNVFSKFGEIKPKFLKNRREYVVDVNSEVEFIGIISGHDEYRGVKKTKIGKISKYR